MIFPEVSLMEGPAAEYSSVSGSPLKIYDPYSSEDGFTVKLGQ